MLNEQISLIVVDDHPKTRKNIINLLQKAEDINIVGEAVNGTQAIDLALKKKPDMMLLDVELPDIMGTEVMLRVKKKLPDLKVLAVSSYNDRQFILGMREKGASGYLLKDELPALLISTIRNIVFKKHGWIGPHVTPRSLSPTLDQTLTRKEAKIMMRLAKNQSESIIATDLNMDEEQINEYINLLMTKYQVNSTYELKKIARQLYAGEKR